MKSFKSFISFEAVPDKPYTVKTQWNENQFSEQKNGHVRKKSWIYFTYLDGVGDSLLDFRLVENLISSLPCPSLQLCNSKQHKLHNKPTKFLNSTMLHWNSGQRLIYCLIDGHQSSRISWYLRLKALKKPSKRNEHFIHPHFSTIQIMSSLAGIKMFYLKNDDCILNWNGFVGNKVP
jgi:hypothetical protein